MHLNQFEALARAPQRTVDELKTMRANALAKGRHDFVRVVDEVLLERQPVAPKKSGGKTPTTASFGQRVEHFDSGKEAYLWLVNQFCRSCPTVLQEYEALHIRAGKRSKGRRFARDPRDLFPVHSSRQGNPSFYSAVGTGWYADVNLNHDDKFASLIQLSHIARLEYEKDWEFDVLGATKQLADHQKNILRAREILEELLRP